MSNNKFEKERELAKLSLEFSGYKVKDGVLTTPDGPILLHGVSEVRIVEKKDWSIYAWSAVSLAFTLASLVTIVIGAIPGAYVLWWVWTACNKQVEIQYGSQKWIVVARFRSQAFERAHAEGASEGLKELIEKNIPQIIK